MKEHISPLMNVQTEFDEWGENGCNKAKELIEKAEDNK